MPCDSGFLFDWHNSPCAINRLLPSWEPVEIKKHPNKISLNEEVELIVAQGPLRIAWHLIHDDVAPGSYFSDSQVSGPFKSWKHIHKFQDINNNGSLLVENISFELPIFNKLISDLFIKPKLKRMFDFRFRTIFNDISKHYKFKENKKMKVLITGSSGLVGSALSDFLSSGGHDVYKLVRSEAKKEREISWLAPQDDNDPSYLDPNDLEGFDAIVHLAGENIANKRWTKEQKEKIYNSRVYPTQLLAKTIAELKDPPKVFICASAIGFYGDRGEEELDETSAPNDSYLSKTCIDWEAASKEISEHGIRVVNARFGIILDPKGGALAKMLPIFSIGGGGILGNGKQHMSWIALDDVLGGLLHCLMDEKIEGAVNFVAPSPVTNNEFTKVLAKVLKRPAIFPAPSFALKLVLGEMADALLLSSTRVKPVALERASYEFSFPNLESALRHMLGK